MVKILEIARKRAYVRQGCPKGTTKAINRASLLVTPISHTHSNYLHMHTSRSRTRTLVIASAILPISLPFEHCVLRELMRTSLLIRDGLREEMRQVYIDKRLLTEIARSFA